MIQIVAKEALFGYLVDKALQKWWKLERLEYLVFQAVPVSLSFLILCPVSWNWFVLNYFNIVRNIVTNDIEELKENDLIGLPDLPVWNQPVAV